MVALPDQVMNVRKTLFAFFPSPELMTHILTPGVWEAPAKGTDDCLKILTLFGVCLVAHDHRLYKAVDGKD